jgi:hypothetical protein
MHRFRSGFCRSKIVVNSAVRPGFPGPFEGRFCAPKTDPGVESGLI